MKSKAVALFLSLGLATTVAACAGQPGDETEGEQTPPAPTIQDDGEEGGAPPGATEDGEDGEDDEDDEDGEDGES